MLVCDAPGADVDTACERLRPRGSAGRASPAVAEPAVSPTVSPSKRDSLLCDGDTVDAVLGSVFD